ncbi:hypothetical protein YPC_3697 [Yersinia pestis biovar Medievalis str. Harbin 35]|nr:hypothetical protein YPC_3697 [Yersinia pestis biovar Medievalis str. Harbin 35]EEO77911.1 hypothetical protein YP516_0763 [Yersinia pestis Nepal516]EEO79140.1 hypothetical protein YPF_4063 [Yersinia pestis biovar Orientalis str. India 195]EEO85418.1 hypothetical protein YPH_1278 [Yersinia pestis biovar Orientalis str. PEXU2]EEO88590.1 hypothetical protein YPS_4316 [Yersinia pestis Pestoides A]
MFGVTPATTYRATLQANKNRWNASEITLALQRLEHFINRVQHQYLYRYSNQ